MKYFVFKNPYKKGDIPLKECSYDPTPLVDSLVLKYGSICILSEEDLKE